MSPLYSNEVRQLRYRDVAIFAMLLVVSLVVPYGAIAAVLMVSLWAYWRAGNALVALPVVASIKSINPALVGSTLAPMTISGWLSILLCTGAILWHLSYLRRGWTPILLSLILFMIVVGLESYFFSNYIAVSLLKLASFGIVFGLSLALSQAVWTRGYNIVPRLHAFWLASALVSGALLLLPSLGFYRDGMGFQGVFNQPQALAIVFTPAFCWAAGVALIQNRRNETWSLILLAAASLAMILLSRGRTGLVAISSSAALASVLLLFSPRMRLQLAASPFAVRAVAVIAAIAALGALFHQPIYNYFTNFLHKGVAGRSLADSWESSRGFLVAESYRNFLDNKLVGIGFGTSRSIKFDFNPSIEPFTGLPLGASTEKANIAIALLEETGLVGTLAFIPFILALVGAALRSTNLAVLWTVLAMILVNTGEMIFFSINGLGLYSCGVVCIMLSATQRTR